MSRSRKFLLIALAVTTAFVLVVTLAGPQMLRSVFYPKPSSLPDDVNESSDQLIVRLEAVLATNAPIVIKSLQLGLSEAQIAELETGAKIRLPQDIRALYRWRNGMATNSTVGLLPGQRFLPLQELIAERALIRRRSGVAFRILAGHREGWLHVLDDGAGDGYFYDPDRKDSEGAFFFHFGEVAHYLWFPSVRNFLSGVIACYESGAVRASADGKSLEEDSRKTEQIWSRFGKSRES
jgi:hypothetical protein